MEDEAKGPQGSSWELRLLRRDAWDRDGLCQCPAASVLQKAGAQGAVSSRAQTPGDLCLPAWRDG